MIFKLYDVSYTISQSLVTKLSCLLKLSRLLLQNYETAYNLMASWLRRWTLNPGFPCSKLQGGSKVDSVFHPSDVDKMSARNTWELSGKK